MVAPKTKTTTEVPEIAVKFSEQVISTVKQYQQLSIDAAQTWAKVAAVFPVAEFPTIPGVPELPSTEALTAFAFDFTTELLTAQRSFALQLANTLS
jgi:hypothetical protein